ncbi:MAG: carbonic anhydrase [Rhizobacter sp.]|nr:carbonic anhydrase [Bacteriovorax sp.]
MTVMDPNAVMKELKDGNTRFANGETIHSAESSLAKLKDFSKTGQFPKAIVLCCSDSRAPVELIFDQDIGDLFVIRVAGNIVAPSLVGSVEYATSMFGTSLVLVMGHTQCGAIRATLSSIEKAETFSENINDIVKRIRPHIFTIAKNKNTLDADKMAQAIEANVRASVGQLETSSQLIEELVRKGKMHIQGAVLNLDTGFVEFLEM